MGVERTSAFPALILGCSLPKCRTVRTGDTDCYRLASFQFLFIGRLVIVPAVGSDIIDIAVFVVVKFRQMCIKLSLECVQIHGIGIEHVFIDYFLVVPAFRDMDFVSVCFLGLFATATDDIAGLVIIDGVTEAVIGIVKLLHPVP